MTILSGSKRSIGFDPVDSLQVSNTRNLRNGSGYWGAAAIARLLASVFQPDRNWELVRPPLRDPAWRRRAFLAQVRLTVRPLRRARQYNWTNTDSNSSPPRVEPVSVSTGNSCRENVCRDQRPGRLVSPIPAGKNFGVAGDRQGFFGVGWLLRLDRDGPSSVSLGKASGTQRQFCRRQETVFAQNCVVELAGLEPTTKRL